MIFTKSLIAFLLGLSFISPHLLPLDNGNKPRDSRKHLNKAVSLESRAASLRGIPAGWDSNRQTYVSKKLRQVPYDEMLPNFDRVSERIYRGGQPYLPESRESIDDGIRLLKKMAVTDIIDLRNPGGSGWVKREAKRSADENICFHSIPMPSFDIGLPVPGKRLHEESVTQVVALLKKLEADHKTIYIHCTYGADRTGVGIALFRLYKGARVNEVMAEAQDHYRAFLSHFQIGMHHLIRKNARPGNIEIFRGRVDREKPLSENCQTPGGYGEPLSGRSALRKMLKTQ